MLKSRSLYNYDYESETIPATPQFKPPISQLDNKDERLLELAEAFGNLDSENRLLRDDNIRMDRENRELRNSNISLKERNTKLETDTKSHIASYNAVSEFIDDVKKALKETK